MATKRVNMDIDADLWKSVKKAAIDQDIELRKWVTQALKEKLGGNQHKQAARGRQKTVQKGVQHSLSRVA